MKTMHIPGQNEMKFTHNFLDYQFHCRKNKNKNKNRGGKKKKLPLIGSTRPDPRLVFDPATLFRPVPSFQTRSPPNYRRRESGELVEHGGDEEEDEAEGLRRRSFRDRRTRLASRFLAPPGVRAEPGGGAVDRRRRRRIRRSRLRSFSNSPPRLGTCSPHLPLSRRLSLAHAATAFGLSRLIFCEFCGLRSSSARSRSFSTVSPERGLRKPR